MIWDSNLKLRGVVDFNHNLKNYNHKLQIFNDKFERVGDFNIAIADDKNKKMYGLMNLHKLPQDYGMLFPFYRNQIVLMWMKNTHIPLDMIFIGADNKIANIQLNAKPYSLEIISSEIEVDKVLEVNAGMVKKLGIKVGQKVQIK